MAFILSVSDSVHILSRSYGMGCYDRPQEPDAEPGNFQSRNPLFSKRSS